MDVSKATDEILADGFLHGYEETIQESIRAFSEQELRSIGLELFERWSDLLERSEEEPDLQEELVAIEYMMNGIARE